MVSDVMNMSTKCSPMIAAFLYTMILASTDKTSGHDYVLKSAGNCFDPPLSQ